MRAKRVLWAALALALLAAGLVAVKWQKERERRELLEVQVRELKLLRRRECISLFDRLLGVKTLASAPRNETPTTLLVQVIKSSYLSLDCMNSPGETDSFKMVADALHSAEAAILGRVSDEEIAKRLAETEPVFIEALERRRKILLSLSPEEL